MAWQREFFDRLNIISLDPKTWSVKLSDPEDLRKWGTVLQRSKELATANLLKKVNIVFLPDSSGPERPSERR